MLNQNDIAEFHENGVVCLRGVLSDWVEPLQHGIEQNIADPGPFVRDYDDGQGGRFFGDFCNWNRFDDYRQFVYASPAAKIAGELMESETVRLFHEHVLVKEPGTAMPTPWHHDQPYYCVDGKQNVSLWMPLDKISKEVAMEFVVGSHRWNRWFRPERFDKSALYDNDPQEPLPDIDADRTQYEIVSFEMEPGDVVAFHYLTLHGAPATTDSSLRRRAFSSRWVGDDATFAVRAGKTSPPFPDCKLKHGAPLSGPEFPLIIGVQGH